MSTKLRAPPGGKSNFNIFGSDGGASLAMKATPDHVAYKEAGSAKPPAAALAPSRATNEVQALQLPPAAPAKPPPAAAAPHAAAAKGGARLRTEHDFYACDRVSTKLHAPPGGHSSITFG